MKLKKSEVMNFPTHPIVLEIHGYKSEYKDIENFKMSLDSFNKEELGILFIAMETAFKVIINKREKRIKTDKEKREYETYLQLKAKFEKQ